MIQNINFYLEGKEAAQKTTAFPQRFELRLLL